MINESQSTKDLGTRTSTKSESGRSEKQAVKDDVIVIAEVYRGSRDKYMTSEGCENQKDDEEEKPVSTGPFSMQENDIYD